jgi:hypothetical protein
MKQFFAMTLIVFGAIALSGIAAHAAEDPHAAPVWTCDSLQFDPAGTIDVTVQFRSNGVVTEQTGSYTPDAGHVVTVDISSLTAGKQGEARASLPGIYPGAWTAWVPLDCRPVTPPPTTPPTTAPPVTVPPAPPAPPAPAVPVSAPVIATGPGTPGDLATTGAFTDELAIVGGLIFAAGMALLWITRKPKAA